tara:strand:- start:315 stop:467 length:153 start_codon:yes stop_codon:yes gene_type:complete
MTMIRVGGNAGSKKSPDGKPGWEALKQTGKAEILNFISIRGIRKREDHPG